MCGDAGWAYWLDYLSHSIGDGRLASCAHDETVKVWDLSEPDGQQCMATLSGHTNRVNSVMALPGGRLISGAADNTVKLWDLNKHNGWLASCSIL
ncbi:WD40 repeat domain-containing protein [Endozoicomonas sp. ONNA2]|uniref:WD40 repeat domain-containing protein n=1 Tax=Endozoicomonas sp. ONNA2 TaxID=2828741 RepID=UPI0021495939|nr:hypothetical protein [Endozoicomonas sp. ONNA2]